MLAVGRGFPPSLKLRRTTVALAEVVKPADAGSEDPALLADRVDGVVRPDEKTPA